MQFLNIISLNTMNFSQGMGFIALLISLYFSLHIFFIQKKNFSRILAFYFFLFFLVQLFNLFYDIGLLKLAEYFIGVFIGARLCISPMLYCYILSITKKDKSPLNIARHLAIPVGIGLIETGLIFAQHRFGEFPIFKDSLSTIVSIFTIIALFVVFVILNIYYIYQSFRLLNKHRSSLGDYFTFEDGVGLKWIRTLIVGYIIYVLTIFIIENVFEDFPEWLYNIFIIAYLGFVGYNGIRQNEVFPVAKSEKLDDKNDNFIAETHIEENKYAELFHRVVALVENEKLYLNQDLTIIDLSKQLKANSKYISQSIKQEYKNNFATFINSYRIEFAKKLLLDKSQENITIEGIAQMSGFKSKSVFNPFFKSQTGMTPKEFKDKSLTNN